MSDNNNQPPPNNPVLTAYETFVRDTPLVTRYVLTALTITFVLSIFIDGFNFALSNIPYFSLGRLELYRILVSPLVCTSFISLVFAYFSFVDHGKRLEFSLGSAQFAYLCGSLAVGINTLHIFVAYTLQLITANHTWIHVKASGIWTVLFPLIAIECIKAHLQQQSASGSNNMPMRRFFMWQVPTLYYPLILLGIFTVMGGYSVSNMIAVATGYAYGYGYLDKTKVSMAQSKQWEETILANFARREGWVVGHAATGQDAWLDMAISGGSGSGGSAGSSSLFRGGGGGGGNTLGSAAAKSPPPAESFPSGGGRQLGGPTRRGGGANADARAARLKALEGNGDNSRKSNSTDEADNNV